MPEVLIMLGSDSDLPKIKSCFETLDKFGVSFEINIASAHRTPEFAKQLAENAKKNGFKVIIAAAGGAAHLPGVVASFTTLPVIGIPIASDISGGLDSILSILQMPSGIPVGTMAAGASSGTNAALYAIRILGIGRDDIDEKLMAHKKEMADGVLKKNEGLKEKGYKQYITSMEKK